MHRRQVIASSRTQLIVCTAIQRTSCFPSVYRTVLISKDLLCYCRSRLSVVMVSAPKEPAEKQRKGRSRGREETSASSKCSQRHGEPQRMSAAYISWDSLTVGSCQRSGSWFALPCSDTGGRVLPLRRNRSWVVQGPEISWQKEIMKMCGIIEGMEAHVWSRGHATEGDAIHWRFAPDSLQQSAPAIIHSFHISTHAARQMSAA